jgi:hypothetical protein
MKKCYGLVLAIALLFSIGAAPKLPLPLEGVYDVKLRTLTYFDIGSKDFTVGWNYAELTPTKPEGLTVGFEYEKLQEIRFGYFKFGNNERQTWFLFGKEAAGGNLQMFIDLNGDSELSPKEKLESLQVFEKKSFGQIRREVFSLIPVPIQVSYKGVSTVYEQKIYYFFDIQFLTKKDKTDVFVNALTAGFLDGEMSFSDGKQTRKIKFRIYDNNGNGCFNDYGTDLLYVDVNNDEFYKKNEMRSLAEFFELADGTGRQLRMVVIPYPAKIAVIGATADLDRATLEFRPEPKEAPAVPAQEAIGANQAPLPALIQPPAATPAPPSAAPAPPGPAGKK